MKLRLLALLGALAAFFALFGGISAEPTKEQMDQSKKALQELGELGFVGQWNLSGEMTIDGKKTLVKETWEWGWKFDKKTGEAWMTLTVKDGRFFVSGDLKYNPEKKVYTFSAKDKANTALEFTGKLVKEKFVLERKDSKSGDVHKFTLNTLSEGIRFNGVYDVQVGGKGLANTVCKLTGGKEGEALAGVKKKNECCVTGGAGTIQVSYMGKTYYVCCTGCKEAFEADPKKIVEEYEKSKKK